MSSSSEGKTRLHYAAAIGSNPTAQILKSDMSDLNTREAEEGLTPLMCAVQSGRRDVVKLLLDSGADINIPNFKGWTALQYAVLHSDKEVVEWLISRGAQVNTRTLSGETPLHYAADKEEILRMLIAAGAEVNATTNEGKTPLFFISMNQTKAAELLLINGADPNIRDYSQKTVLEHIPTSARWHSIRMLLMDYAVPATRGILHDDRAPKISEMDEIRIIRCPSCFRRMRVPTDRGRLAIRCKNCSHRWEWSPDDAIFTEQLIAKFGGDLDKALQEAIKSRNEASIRILISEGAELNKRAALLGFHDELPLHLAVSLGRKNIVNLLLEYKATVTLEDQSNRHPLHVAAELGHRDIVQILINSGSPVNHPTRGQPGTTPLASAIRNGHRDAARALLDHGADINKGDFQGRTPLHNAAYDKNHAMVMFCLGNGSNVNSADEKGRF